MTELSLRDVERRAFTSAFDDGLWDVLVGAFLSIFAIAPVLSDSMGDFWSSAVFLPGWAVLYAGILLIRRYIVRSRLGTMHPGRRRRRRLSALVVTLVVVNVLSLIAGLLIWFSPAVWLEQFRAPLGLGVPLLILLSLAAHFLDIPRYFVYGVLVMAASLLTGILSRHTALPHHGYPLAFGAVAGIVMICGVVRLILLLRAAGPPSPPDFGASPSTARHER